MLGEVGVRRDIAPWLGRRGVADPLHAGRVGVEVPSREELPATVGGECLNDAADEDSEMLVDGYVGRHAVDGHRVVACDHTQAGEVIEVELLLARNGVYGVDTVVHSLEPEGWPVHSATEGRGGEPLHAIMHVER